MFKSLIKHLSIFFWCFLNQIINHYSTEYLQINKDNKNILSPRCGKEHSVWDSLSVFVDDDDDFSCIVLILSQSCWGETDQSAGSSGHTEDVKLVSPHVYGCSRSCSHVQTASLTPPPASLGSISSSSRWFHTSFTVLNSRYRLPVYL